MTHPKLPPDKQKLFNDVVDNFRSRFRAAFGITNNHVKPVRPTDLDENAPIDTQGLTENMRKANTL